MSLKFFIKHHIPSGIVQGKSIRKDGAMPHYDIALQIDKDSYLLFSTIKQPTYDTSAKIFVCYREKVTLKDLQLWSQANGSTSTEYDEGSYEQVYSFSDALCRRKPSLYVRFNGNVLKGVWRFEKMNEFWKTGKPKFRHEAEGHSWLMIKCTDSLYEDSSMESDSSSVCENNNTEQTE